MPVWTHLNNHGEMSRVRQLRHQCPDFGLLVSTALKHALATPETPELNVDLLLTGVARREAERREYYERRSQERRQEYEIYLQTDAWQEKRELVFTRANGMCEGCRQAPACQVHHVTYEHVGNEFLWELVAVCRVCHARYHDVQ
jgi:5-methylcytosine-specific restriction endonuclease McrA